MSRAHMLVGIAALGLLGRATPVEMLGAISLAEPRPEPLPKPDDIPLIIAEPPPVPAHKRPNRMPHMGKKQLAKAAKRAKEHQP